MDKGFIGEPQGEYECWYCSKIGHRYFSVNGTWYPGDGFIVYTLCEDHLTRNSPAHPEVIVKPKEINFSFGLGE